MIGKLFLKGDTRTVKARKNIIASIFLKGLDGIIYLLLVPVTLGYLNQYEYGIWLTLSSILMWINSFDIGLGNGMRNKLAVALAKEDYELGRIYVSTTFYMLIILMGGLIMVGSIINPFINWYEILNTNADVVPHLNQIVYIAFFIFCINFIFKFVGNVYLSLQLPSVNNLLVVSGNGLALVSVYILTKVASSNLLYVAVAYSLSPLIIYLLAFPITFKWRYPKLAPSFKYFKTKFLKELFNIGLQFFVLQISGILMFSITNLIISHMFGPDQVTPYNISYRYLSVMIMFSNLVMTPMWSATTDAYVRGEMSWIKNTNKKIQKFLIFVTIGLLLMVLASKWIYNIWIGTKVQIPFLLTLVMAGYDAVILWSLSYSVFLNGFGKLRLQTIMSVIMAIIVIPLSFLSGSVFGVIGIVALLTTLHSIALLINKIQFDKLINNTAEGIWNK